MPEPGPLAQLLRWSRDTAGISQFEMSLRLGVSQRHVSFIESARAKPSRGLLLAWMREVQADASLRNAALLHAGFALRRVHSDRGHAVAALRQMLALHEPNAGLVFDADWMTVELNDGARWICGEIMPDLARECDGRQVDMLAALEHPGGFLSRARDPARAAAALVAQLHAEKWARPALRERVQRVAGELERRYRLPATRAQKNPMLPYLDVSFDTDHGPLSFLLVQSVFGLPHDVTVGSLRMELWFPSDEHTKRMMRNRTSGVTRVVESGRLPAW